MPTLQKAVASSSPSQLKEGAQAAAGQTQQLSPPANMAKFTVYDAFQLAWKTKWRHQKSHKDQHRNGMQAVEFFGKTKLLKNITTPDPIEYQQDLQKPRPHAGMAISAICSQAPSTS